MLCGSRSGAGEQSSAFEIPKGYSQLTSVGVGDLEPFSGTTKGRSHVPREIRTSGILAQACARTEKVWAPAQYFYNSFMPAEMSGTKIGL